MISQQRHSIAHQAIEWFDDPWQRLQATPELQLHIWAHATLWASLLHHAAHCHAMSCLPSPHLTGAPVQVIFEEEVHWQLSPDVQEAEYEVHCRHRV